MSLKYPKPRILLIDLPQPVEARLQAEGFNVEAGTFGSPYKVPMKDGFHPVVCSPRLPHYTEQEVIVLDLTPPDTVESPVGEKPVSEGELDWWAKCSSGQIDPRPRTMAAVQDAFDRILSHGGLFVVFAQPSVRQNLVWGRVKYGDLRPQEELHYDNWCFLSLFADHDLMIRNDHGTEISRAADSGFLYNCVRPYLNDAEYTATIHPASWFNNSHRGFFPLMLSKYMAPVGGIFLFEKPTGSVLVLPQIARKDELLAHLMKTAIPDLAPQLFPHVESKRWLKRDEYEHPSVVRHKKQQVEIQQSAQNHIEALEQQIEEERTRFGFLHNILTKTDRELVASVKAALTFLGFQQVKDVDAEEADANKQEDLQLLDPPRPLILEVKGLAGLPTESDTLQVSKYVLRRMKEWNRTDVRGVSIINHQRNLPALERSHDRVFTPQQVEDAENHEMALFTTWDLFRLIRGMMRWNWPPETIRDLLYRDGRIEAIPCHYKPIGKVVHFWDQLGVMSIELAEGSLLRQSDTLGFVFPDHFHEERAESLHIEKAKVMEAHAGDRVGHKTSLARPDVPDGTTVYNVDIVAKAGGTP